MNDLNSNRSKCPRPEQIMNQINLQATRIIHNFSNVNKLEPNSKTCQNHFKFKCGITNIMFFMTLCLYGIHTNKSRLQSVMDQMNESRLQSMMDRMESLVSHDVLVVRNYFRVCLICLTLSKNV